MTPDPQRLRPPRKGLLTACIAVMAGVSAVATVPDTTAAAGSGLTQVSSLDSATDLATCVRGERTGRPRLRTWASCGDWRRRRPRDRALVDLRGDRGRGERCETGAATIAFRAKRAVKKWRSHSGSVAHGWPRDALAWHLYGAAPRPVGTTGTAGGGSASAPLCVRPDQPRRPPLVGGPPRRPPDRRRRCDVQQRPHGRSRRARGDDRVQAALCPAAPTGGLAGTPGGAARPNGSDDDRSQYAPGDEDHWLPWRALGLEGDRIRFVVRTTSTFAFTVDCPSCDPAATNRSSAGLVHVIGKPRRRASPTFTPPHSACPQARCATTIPARISALPSAIGSVTLSPSTTAASAKPDSGCRNCSVAMRWIPPRSSAQYHPA